MSFHTDSEIYENCQETCSLHFGRKITALYFTQDSRFYKFCILPGKELMTRNQLLK